MSSFMSIALTAIPSRAPFAILIVILPIVLCYASFWLWRVGRKHYTHGSNRGGFAFRAASMIAGFAFHLALAFAILAMPWVLFYRQ